jgi:hypothetical protein
MAVKHGAAVQHALVLHYGIRGRFWSSAPMTAGRRSSCSVLELQLRRS